MNTISVDKAIELLREGNERFVSQARVLPNQSAERRNEVKSGQTPFAVVLGCADSRVPPEILFDRGIGDLFIVRVAGNILTGEVLGSIEYAVDHLGVQFILVLGHEGCGAAAAALKGGPPEGHIRLLTKAIQPCVKAALQCPGDPLENVVRLHVQRVVSRMKRASPILKERVENGAAAVRGGIYRLESGLVEILE